MPTLELSPAVRRAPRPARAWSRGITSAMRRHYRVIPFGAATAETVGGSGEDLLVDAGGDETFRAASRLFVPLGWTVRLMVRTGAGGSCWLPVVCLHRRSPQPLTVNLIPMRPDDALAGEDRLPASEDRVV